MSRHLCLEPQLDVVAKYRVLWLTSVPLTATMNSLISGMKRAIEAIKEKANGRVDYLFETQGGPPMGNYNLTKDGIETHFAIQVLSRFALNDSLASEGILKIASVNIAAPGSSVTSFDLNDIESKSTKDSNAISLLLAKAKNEGTVTDAATLVSA